jgi:hypothetical protein
VLTAGAGTVHFAGRVAGRGVVSVTHPNGLRTTYEPLEPAVRAGQALAAGDPIGTLVAGHAGCPAAACLHWGLRRGEEYLDPLILLGLGRVRLLPLASTPPAVVTAPALGFVAGRVPMAAPPALVIASVSGLVAGRVSTAVAPVVVGVPVLGFVAGRVPMTAAPVVVTAPGLGFVAGRVPMAAPPALVIASVSGLVAGRVPTTAPPALVTAPAPDRAAGGVR